MIFTYAFLVAFVFVVFVFVVVVFVRLFSSVFYKGLSLFLRVFELSGTFSCS